MANNGNQSTSPLPSIGFLRLEQIIGRDEVTEEQAAENRKSGRGPKRPRKGIPAIIPIKKSAWWHGCATGRYPKPLHLPSRVTVWRVEDIRALIAQIVEDNA